MSSADRNRITGLLQAATLRGDGPPAGNTDPALEPLLYSELKALAAQLMAGERVAHTLQATALVHEAWLRLRPGTPEGPRDDARAYFLGSAARAMRRILVEHARAKAAAKRGGGQQQDPLERHAEALAQTVPVDVLELQDALERLAAIDPQLERIVELRYFAGLTLEDTGAALGISTSQAHRAWGLARAWLQRELGSGGEPQP